MVALLRHQPATRRLHSDPADPSGLPFEHGADRVPLRLVHDDHRRRAIAADDDVITVDPVRTADERPRLELLPGLDGPVRPSLGVIAVAALVVFGLFGVIRVVQGAPGAEAGGADGATAAVVAVPAEGDRVIVAGAGDTLWSIAVSLAPDDDPRPVVAALIDANDGDSVQIGQQIVIPSRLFD